ncbi:GNAT family N-acetyltransferase [Deinococcus sp. KNUC1210]|uniref:GNAT family N-acetyltransferase n=1 Tax=Deinococcus sp. KNUC1210 TaxID=2917691 RepID=UPI001EEF8B6A|nr:GNAT family N-acetyltransferase [Deinococcus sp. KNUC1210]ULH15648.1 GNAT family N-acetyltransferase [Deinococcus sp. KNUC1210]
MTQARSPVVLRPLTATDAPDYFPFRLRGLEESPLAFGRSADEYRQETPESVAASLEPLEHERVTFGAFVEGKLVGSMTLVRQSAHKQRHKAMLYAVYVAPEARGQHVGSQLLDALLKWAGTVPGLRQIQLAVSVPQDAAYRLYLRGGFTVYGREPRALHVGGQDVDEYLMVRVLDS